MSDPLQIALTYADNIIATLREPFVVLDKSLRVRTANAAFYRDFQVSKAETVGRFVSDLGNGQWDIPQLRTLLSQVLSKSHPIGGFGVEQVRSRVKEHAAQRPPVRVGEQRTAHESACTCGHHRTQ